jgi:hypothetical protein
MKPRYVGIGRPRRGPNQAAAPRHSLQGEIIMPIPQVNDRIKEAPAVMLRAVFAGVGQLLLAADKVRARAAGTGWPPDRTAPKGQPRAQSRWHALDDTPNGTVPLARERVNPPNHSAHRPAPAGSSSATAAPARAEAPAPAEAPAFAEAPAPAEAPASVETPALAEAPAPTEAPAPAEAAATTPTAPAEPEEEHPLAAAPAPAKPGDVAEPAGDAPPLPGYDDLSLPSLRARMRAKDAATLRAMLAYEKAHAHRDDVIAMFERRLTKIDAE